MRRSCGVACVARVDSRVVVVEDADAEKEAYRNFFGRKCCYR